MTCYVYDYFGAIGELGEYAKRYHDFNFKGQSYEIVQEDQSVKIHWDARKIGELIKKCKPFDIVIVYSGPDLAASITQIIEILKMAAQKHIEIHFVRYGFCLANASPEIDIQKILGIIGTIESDFISRRTCEALAKRRARGLPVGRPKGIRNKSLKLDKFSEDIKKYFDLGISKASIAKLVDCHPQTLYDWLEKNGLHESSVKLDPISHGASHASA